MIISNKHSMPCLLDELRNEERFKILGNKEIKRKSQNFIELLPSALHETKVLQVLVKIFRKTETNLFPYWTISHEN